MGSTGAAPPPGHRRGHLPRGFQVCRPLTEALGLLSDYDVVVVDEALQLSAEEFGRLDAMFMAAGKRLLLLLLMGDGWQLPSIHPEQAARPRRPPARGPALRPSRAAGEAGLPALYHKPMGADGRRFVNRLCHCRKAWSGHHEPTNLDIEDVLRRTEGRTTFVTCTRRGAARINALAVEVLALHQPARAVPGPHRGGPPRRRGQLHGGGQAARGPAPAPHVFEPYRGLRVVLTRNQDKARHYGNGMLATVEAFHAETKAVQVLTESGQRLAIYPFTDTDLPNGLRAVYYPLRVGYAGTIHKYQGAELDHVTLWLDRPWCAAAAYVALSRVRRDEDYLIGGIVIIGFIGSRPVCPVV